MVKAEIRTWHLATNVCSGVEYDASTRAHNPMITLSIDHTITDDDEDDDDDICYAPVSGVQIYNVKVIVLLADG